MIDNIASKHKLVVARVSNEKVEKLPQKAVTWLRNNIFYFVYYAFHKHGLRALLNEIGIESSTRIENNKVVKEVAAIAFNSAISLCESRLDEARNYRVSTEDGYVTVSRYSKTELVNAVLNKAKTSAHLSNAIIEEHA